MRLTAAGVVELMADEKTTVIIHGGREEVRFCFTHVDLPPSALWGWYKLPKDFDLAVSARV